VSAADITVIREALTDAGDRYGLEALIRLGERLWAMEKALRELDVLLDGAEWSHLVNSAQNIIADAAESVSDENFIARVDEARRILATGDDTQAIAYLTGASVEDVRRVSAALPTGDKA
jgi:hypothetical protein